MPKPCSLFNGMWGLRSVLLSVGQASPYMPSFTACSLVIHRMLLSLWYMEKCWSN